MISVLLIRHYCLKNSGLRVLHYGMCLMDSEAGLPAYGLWVIVGYGLFYIVYCELYLVNSALWLHQHEI